ncbi:hypothetical protein SLOPH_1058 [Spraguea lophii 42_110]|uniref:Uncharacterized protein n=1 Tax=Spraguea lophii (strain 42_110) TaxID=1358809 RepID=S7XRV5_SPRLO|nr:hypothetical protein SLOPH_1058 [Spraguea lophii 42_110]
MKSLSECIENEDFKAILQFQQLDNNIKTQQLNTLSSEEKIKYLQILIKLLKRGEDIFNNIKELILQSGDIFLNKEFRKEINNCCNILKRYSINYNKLIYLKGKIDSLEFKKRNKKQPNHIEEK